MAGRGRLKIPVCKDFAKRDFARKTNLKKAALAKKSQEKSPIGAKQTPRHVAMMWRGEFMSIREGNSFSILQDYGQCYCRV
jgi:hypothetical protein